MNQLLAAPFPTKTSLMHGGNQRMARLMRLVLAQRIGLAPLVTHRFRCEEVSEAYALFASQSRDLLKVAIAVP